MNVPASMETAATLRRPRLGFLGAGWIGRHRLQALAASGAGTVTAIADTDASRVAEAGAAAPDAARLATREELLELDLDGVVIATPSALHAQQAVRALAAGCAVFCQKPLARTAAETAAVIAAARAADLLLDVDLSYRWTSALQQVREAVRSGAVGDVFAVDLTFHNTYGPDRGWARDPALAGGGCVIDLGIHLVDMALWVLDFPAVGAVTSQLYSRGRRLEHGQQAECEDHAVATLELDGGAVARLACSWESSTGRDAIIEATFHGSSGTAALRNVNGSFFDFGAWLHRGTASEVLAAPPDDWGGRALVEWSRRLAAGERYDASVETLVDVAAVLDRVLGR